MAWIWLNCQVNQTQKCNIFNLRPQLIEDCQWDLELWLVAGRKWDYDEHLSNEGSCLSLSVVWVSPPVRLKGGSKAACHTHKKWLATSIIPIIKCNLRYIYLTRTKDLRKKNQPIVHLLNIAFTEEVTVWVTER